LQARYWRLVREHCHVLNAAASGLSALPGAAESFACTQAMYRFLKNPEVTLPALIEPVRDAVRGALDGGRGPVLIAHDWSMLHFGGHASKADRYQRTHKADLGYELACALALDAASGAPLGPLEIRLRTAAGVLATRPGGAAAHAIRRDEVIDVMRASGAWGLGRDLVHIIDREADSVWHYRLWDESGHRFLVRVDDARVVRWGGQERRLPEVADALWAGPAAAVVEADEPIDYKGAAARLQVAETGVVLFRPARRTIDGRQKQIAGRPLRLRLIVGRVVGPGGEARARWMLLSNVAPGSDALTITRWYYWRWRIESYFKLLKSAGQQVEEWEQESGEAIARRLVIAGMACVTAWSLQRDPRPAAAELRRVLIRLSGRQMKHRVASTAPALLAGLEKLLAVVDLLEHYDPDELRRLARSTLPLLFNSS
jgi:hypothetical protein